MPDDLGHGTLAHLSVPALGEGVDGGVLAHRAPPPWEGSGQVGAGFRQEVSVGGQAGGTYRPVNHSEDGLILQVKHKVKQEKCVCMGSGLP